MTFEDIAGELPNGFHDAKICSIALNFIERSARLSMLLLVGVPDAPDAEEYRPGVLTLVGLTLFFVDRPSPGYQFVPDGLPLNAEGDSVPTGPGDKAARLLALLPPPRVAYRFFLEQWNSFVYVAGTCVEFS